MPYLRRIYRIIMIILWLFVMYFYALAVRFLGGKSGYVAVKRLSKAAKVWGYGLSKILNIEISIHGNVDNVNGLIVSNHLSYIDILVTATVFPLRFTPNTEIANWSFLGWFLKCSRPIWIDRKSRQSSRKTLNEFINTLKNDINLIIFPEGTTTDGKSDLLPFKSTTFEAAVKGNLPVYPILIHYKEEAGTSICWYGDTTLTSHTWKCFGLKKIETEIHILEPVFPLSKNRKIFSKEVHEIMNTEYQKLCS